MLAAERPKSILVVRQEERWIVWDGWASPGGYESCFVHHHILAAGTTFEAAAAAKRLLEL